MRLILLSLLASLGSAALVSCSLDGAERVAAAPACAERVFEGSAFTVCRFDARADEMRMTYRDASGRPLRSLAALERSLGADAARVRFAVNGGMFDEAGAPIGLFVEGGRERHAINLRAGPGNFHLLPNGVFAVTADGRVGVSESRAFAAAAPAARWATQSGPMLVMDGKLHPKFDADGPSRLIRNGVGVSEPHRAWFAISAGPVSVGKFARLFRDGLGCPNALFLDGSVSSLWNPAGARQDDVTALGPMIVVLRR